MDVKNLPDRNVGNPVISEMEEKSITKDEFELFFKNRYSENGKAPTS